MWPVRLSVMTLNLWNTRRWEERRPALESLFAHAQPDLLAVQELRAESGRIIETCLPAHDHVVDDFEGWSTESNLYWRADLLGPVAHGAEHIGHIESARRLFWVRLQPCGTSSTLLVATVHFTCPEHPAAGDLGGALCNAQATNTASVLHRLREGDETVVLMGDFNSDGVPVRILREHGLEYLQASLGRSPSPTYPVLPTKGDAARTGIPLRPQVLDWIFTAGPCHVLGVEVIDFFHGDMAPSDHRPVQGFLQL